VDFPRADELIVSAPLLAADTLATPEDTVAVDNRPKWGIDGDRDEEEWGESVCDADFSLVKLFCKIFFPA